ncbi:MAG: Hsp70 family protein, partial [Vicinamibacteria bacterium]
MAVVREGEAAVLAGPDGERLVPSVVAKVKNGPEGWLVGSEGKRQAALRPEDTIYSIKRFMGLRYADSEEERSRVAYRVIAAEDSAGLRVCAGDEILSPVDVSAKILKEMKRRAEAALGERIERAVITVPAYFNDAQRQATAEAGRRAGFRVERIINEPTAASLAYGLDRREEGKVAVYDFGGGTFDISILEIRDGVVEVRSTCGDTHLGGDDLDRRIVEWALREFETREGRAFPASSIARARLREAAERAKCELSFVDESRIAVPFTAGEGRSAVHLDLTLKRSVLVDLVADLLDRTRDLCVRALEDAGLKPQEIEHVVLVGGSTRMPAVQDRVRGLFGREPVSNINPDEVVALGAAIQGSI